MLHEIILSLSGHPSPLLSKDSTKSTSTIISPQEKALLGSVARLSDLHCKILTNTDVISSKHASNICQAVATSIRCTHLARFQRKILEVESNILRHDAGSVGAYNIVPLTAVVGEFSEWNRRMEWFWEITRFMIDRNCNGARIIEKLCNSMQTGYSDIQEVSSDLTKVAETAWLKQASSWILYGRLPASCEEDFFIQKTEGAENFTIETGLLPNFVTSSSASSILFIGQSLNHIRTKTVNTSINSTRLVPHHLRLLSTLNFPITAFTFSTVISSIRSSLSQNALQQILPLSRILETLSLLYEFFILRRGDFAIALITEADEKIRSRWRRADNLAHHKRDKLNDIVVKEGEVNAVLARTWTAMLSLQGMNDAEDEQLESARDVIRLRIVKNQVSTSPFEFSTAQPSHPSQTLVSTPFNTLLLSVPTELSLVVSSPIDLFLTDADIRVYSTINSYLLAIRRAHTRLSDLWKITSLRRNHPTPPAPPYGTTPTGRAVTVKLRGRVSFRSKILRSVWATSSAALFLLAETESYFQDEVVAGNWEAFSAWLTGDIQELQTESASTIPRKEKQQQPVTADDDLWSTAGRKTSPNSQHFLTSDATTTKPRPHDPQSLSTSHIRYLTSLARSLLLTNSLFTTPLYELLQKIDHLVALVHRIHAIWQSLDLEEDAGVVEAFSDFQKEEKEVITGLDSVVDEVKKAVEDVVQGLRQVEEQEMGVNSGGFGNLGVGVGDAAMEDLAGADGGMAGLDIKNQGMGDVYRPKKVGRVDRLLMKLDFGTWFEDHRTGDSEEQGFEDDDE